MVIVVKKYTMSLLVLVFHRWVIHLSHTSNLMTTSSVRKCFISTFLILQNFLFPQIRAINAFILSIALPVVFPKKAGMNLLCGEQPRSSRESSQQLRFDWVVLYSWIMNVDKCMSRNWCGWLGISPHLPPRVGSFFCLYTFDWTCKTTHAVLYQEWDVNKKWTRTSGGPLEGDQKPEWV